MDPFANLLNMQETRVVWAAEESSLSTETPWMNLARTSRSVTSLTRR